MAPVPFELEPDKTALMVVDVQRHAADPTVGVSLLLKDRYPEIADYYLNRLEQTTLPAIHRLLGFFRENDLRVFFFAIGPWFEDRSDLTKRQRQREVDIGSATGHQILFPYGHPVYELLPELERGEDELLFHKNSVSAFTSTGLDRVLRNLGIEYLIFTGLATQACVETTARDAVDRGYNSVLVDDACITFTQAAHDATLLNFSISYGRVDDTDSVIAELTGKLSPQAVHSSGD
jgi:nicotinamidase-related amidase